MEDTTGKHKRDLRLLYLMASLALLLLACASCSFWMQQGHSQRVARALMDAALGLLAVCVIHASSVRPPRPADMKWYALISDIVWNVFVGSALLMVGGQIVANGGKGTDLFSGIAGGLFLLIGGWIFVQGTLILPDLRPSKAGANA